MDIPKRKKERKNPTYKQQLVIADVTEKVKAGKPMDMVKSVEKFYNVKNNNTARQVVAANMRSETFREALISSLVERKVLGKNSKTEAVLVEGLDALTPAGEINYDTRLKYVQEIHKVAGIYAPETKRNLNLNMDMSEEELDEKIKKLQEQLE